MIKRLKFRAFSEEEGKRLIEEAGDLERRTKPKGHHNGVLTNNGYFFLCVLMQLYLNPESPAFNLSPPLDEVTTISPRSLQRALKALKDNGFLARITDDTTVN